MRELLAGVVELTTKAFDGAYQLQNLKCNDLTFAQVQEITRAVHSLQNAANRLRQIVNRVEDKFVNSYVDDAWGERESDSHVR